MLIIFDIVLIALRQVSSKKIIDIEENILCNIGIVQKNESFESAMLSFRKCCYFL